MYIAAAVALFAVGSHAAVLRVNNCAADNCLRAIRATAFPTRPGTADCFAYFQKTVTPDVVTVTVTNTAQVTAQAVESVVQTNTKHDTITNTENLIATVASPYTQTVTTTVYSDPNPALGRRTVDAIPAYASPCSSIERYSSACSCIGATPTTLTLAASTTTVTADATATVATKTQTVVYTTEYTTIIDGTTTVQTTTATRTTAQLVATATETVKISLSDAFSLRIETGANAGKYVGNEVDNQYGFLSTSTNPYRFSFNSDNHTVALNGRKVRYWNSGSTGSYAMLTGDNEPGYSPMVSTILSDGTLVPTTRGWSDWWSCKNDNEYHIDIMHFKKPSSGGIGQGNPCEVVQVKAHRWVF